MDMNHTPTRAIKPPLWSRIKGMFNLNDPRWGRGDDEGQRPSGSDNQPPQQPPQEDQQPWRQPEQRPRGGANQGPPDLDELWRDFNRKLSGLFGGKGCLLYTSDAADE